MTLKIEFEKLLAIAVARKDEVAIDWFLNQLKHLAKPPDTPVQSKMRGLMHDLWMADIECDDELIESSAQKIRLLICQVATPISNSIN